MILDPEVFQAATWECHSGRTVHDQAVKDGKQFGSMSCRLFYCGGTQTKQKPPGRGGFSKLW
jgi:hypothetical protein